MRRSMFKDNFLNSKTEENRFKKRVEYASHLRNATKKYWEIEMRKKKIDNKQILKTIKRLISDKSFLRDRIIFLEKD